VIAPDWIDQLAADRAALDRGSTAERVADVLRDRITDGVFAPGTRLNEEALSRALGVSRNTLREAFRLLSHDGVLSYEFNRGVFVRELSIEDIRDLCAMRRILELAAIRGVPSAPEAAFEHLRAALAAADAAAARREWRQVGSANMRFHQAIGELAGSRRVAETLRRLLAELRLAFLAVRDVRALHEPYVKANRELFALITTRNADVAEAALAAYLDQTEAQLFA
jgi:DNA-binding GntR family transcriptional regulator